MHPVGQQRIVNLPHPHPRALLHPLDRRLGGQAAVDRFVDPPRPALVIGEHLVGFQNLLMLALHAELGRAGHPVDLLAHLGKGGNDARALRLGIFRDGMFDMDARLVEHHMPPRHPHHQLQPMEQRRAGIGHAQLGLAIVGQFGIGDQLRHHHGDGLERLYLHLFIFARVGMLHAQDADRPFASHDRHTGKAVEQFLPGFGAIAEIGMRRRFVQVQRLDIGGDQADQPLAHRHPGDMHRFLLQPARREQFQHALAHQIDGADFARQRLADHLDHLVQLALRAGARRHHLLQADQDLAGGGGGGAGHGFMRYQMRGPLSNAIHAGMMTVCVNRVTPSGI